MGSYACAAVLEHAQAFAVLRQPSHWSRHGTPSTPKQSWSGCSIAKRDFNLKPGPDDVHKSLIAFSAGLARRSRHAGLSGSVCVDRRSRQRQRGLIVCRAGAGAAGKKDIKVVVVGVGSDIGREVVRAVQRARGMEVVGAVDRACAGEDIGELAGLEALELPVLNDVVMVLSSVAQAQDDLGVVVDVGGGGSAYESVRQATAFGLRSVVGAQDLTQKQLTTLIDFCDKSSMGCVAAPSFSVGEVLLQQAAVAAGFYYGDVDIEERLDPAQQSAPSASVLRTAEALKGLGREFNYSEESEGQSASGEDLLETTDVGEGLVVHSRKAESGQLYAQRVEFRGAGERWEMRHTVESARGYMPGVLLAIRKVVRMRSMVYGLEKIL